MSRLYHLRDFCRAERDWLIDTIETLVRLESPTTDKAAVDRCGRELAARLAAIGGRVTPLPRSDRGDHLLAEFGCGTSQILLLGHFDTVWPLGQIDRMPVTRSNGRLYGPGVFDMKAGIGIGMLATRALLETDLRLREPQSHLASARPRQSSPETGRERRRVALSRRIVMLWTSDEEIGSSTSRDAIEQEARRSEAVLVLEPSLPGGALKTARKGVGAYELLVRGVAAHAGIEPEKGASAVHELAQQIIRIAALQDLENGIGVNVTVVNGGTRTNVIPEAAHATVDVRVARMSDARRIDAELTGLKPVDARTSLEWTGGIDRPPLERTAGVVRLYDQARTVARELGYELGEGASGGGSDGNFTAALGVSTLDGLGAIGDGAHALHEHVEIDRLADRAALVAGLLAAL